MITYTVDGVQWARQDDVLAQLGPDVTSGMLREWARTRGLARRRTGREVWWDLQAAIECDLAVRASGHGRPRRAHLRRMREVS